MTDGRSAWARACEATELFAIDPAGLGGIWLRARAGPVRTLWLARLRAAIAPRLCRSLGPAPSDEVLFGGVDISATLSAGAVVRTQGIISRASSVMLLPMAERTTPGLAGRLARILDAGHALVAFDEAADPDEGLPPTLADRLGLCVDLSSVFLGDCDGVAITRRRRSPSRSITDIEAVTELTVLAAQHGIASLRIPSLAIRAARASSARDGRTEMTDSDLCAAAELVVAPRAISLPEAQEPAEEDPTQVDRNQDCSLQQSECCVQDLLLDAARAALPTGLLDVSSEAAARDRRRRPGQGGAPTKGNRRGRRLPARACRPNGPDRIDLIATLRAAAPWQTMRRAELGCGDYRLLVRPADIRARRYEQRSDRLVVIAVDASGSTACARLAEAKGAVEILLSEAYTSRNHVALVAFRGDCAEVLIPPTRSLVQARRRLGALTGGGATPLARGLMVAHEVAEAGRKRGLDPAIAILSDGRANIALDGRHDRTAARGDTMAAVRNLAARRFPAAIIDVGVRPEPFLRTLAQEMSARWFSLPRADAVQISTSVASGLSMRK